MSGSCNCLGDIEAAMKKILSLTLKLLAHCRGNPRFANFLHTFFETVDDELDLYLERLSFAAQQKSVETNCPRCLFLERDDYPLPQAPHLPFTLLSVSDIFDVLARLTLEI